MKQPTGMVLPGYNMNKNSRNCITCRHIPSVLSFRSLPPRMVTLLKFAARAPFSSYLVMALHQKWTLYCPYHNFQGQTQLMSHALRTRFCYLFGFLPKFPTIVPLLLSRDQTTHDGMYDEMYECPTLVSESWTRQTMVRSPLSY